MENRANSGSKDASEEDAAIAAALQNSLFYSQHPSNFLYSQWLASRNTSALFGLQGLSNICQFIKKRKLLFSYKVWVSYDKVKKILKVSMDSIPSPSPSKKIKIMGWKFCLRCKENHCWTLSTNFIKQTV